MEIICDYIDNFFLFISKKLDYRFIVFFHTMGKWGGEKDYVLDTINSSIEPFTILMLLEETIKYKKESQTNYIYFNLFCKTRLFTNMLCSKLSKITNFK